ncbi:bacterial regulatory s, gntR family protein [Bordetella holmesii 70147]|nr:bacterial regulatory s, gntR family protein [Bordetella holmesii 35009]EWM51255.1 bacterial regulatory s, gntR family protein [Bordetella holmesii 70147]
MQHFFMSSDFRTPVKAPATIPYFLQEQIRELIIDGTFAPGEPLREQDLEQRFGTSRSPIREALRLLELTGMVAHVQRRGSGCGATPRSKSSSCAPCGRNWRATASASSMA